MYVRFRIPPQPLLADFPQFDERIFHAFPQRGIVANFPGFRGQQFRGLAFTGKREARVGRGGEHPRRLGTGGPARCAPAQFFRPRFHGRALREAIERIAAP